MPAPPTAPPRVATSTPLLDDQPSDKDLLHFDQFVDALDAVICNPEAKTPFIVGVFGRWGTGKTTLMRMLEARLQKHERTTVWFGAWLYNQEKDIWAALLQAMASTLARRLSPWQKLRFALGLYNEGIDGTRLLLALPAAIGMALWVGLPILAGYLLSLLFPSETAKALTQVGGVLGATALFATSVLRPAARAIRERVKGDLNLYRSMDYSEHIGMLDRFREQFERIVRALPVKARPVVVFIDDLDRCGSDKALELLDTIKVFLDVPGCAFVLGADVSVIQQALKQKYPDDAIAQDEYLSKIVQLAFHLPALTEPDLEDYLEGLQVSFPDTRCNEVMLACRSRNPRELKRIINTYALHWHLSQTRASAATVAPVRLAKIVVLQHAFPRLYAVLRDQPVLLGVLERSFRASLLRESSPVPPEEKSDPSLSEITVIQTASGVSLPPSLLPFADDLTVRHLLTLHGEEAADANFASLTDTELLVCFNVTYRDAHKPSTPGAIAPPPPAPVPQVDLGQRYSVVERLALGGSSEVYLAEDRNTRRRVAIKRLVSSLSDDSDWMRRFEREIRVLERVSRHPNIASVIDSGRGRDADGREFPFYVMEHAPGDTLQALLVRKGRLSPRELAVSLLPVFDALQHVHEAGVVHRDIKPSSIVITPTGSPRLIDFGLAVESLIGHDEYTRTGDVLGTPAYMSPEQVLGTAVGPASDLYSLGVVLYEAATGKNPIRDNPSFASSAIAVVQSSFAPPSSSASDYLWAFDLAIARLLEKDPASRFASAAEARLALNEALAVNAPPVTPPPT